MRIRSQLARRSAAVVAGVALAVGGAGVLGAVQANAAPAAPAKSSVAVAKSVTIKADKTRVKAWSKVSLTGRTTGIAANTVVQVQRLQNGKWVNFPATTKVTRSGSYSVWVKSGRVGVNKFRVVAAKTASTAVSVTVVK